MATTKYETNAYLQWASWWRDQSKNKVNGKKVSSPPAGTWDRIKTDAAQFAKWQKKAAEVNKAEGRIPRKGNVKRTASTKGPSGWTEFQIRLGQLNDVIAAAGYARLKCTDPMVARCKVTGKDKKIDGEASIAELEAAFLDAYSDCFAEPDPEEADDTQDNE